MPDQLRAVFLLGTLKKKQQLSHTQVLCDIVAEVFREKENVESDIIRLRDFDIQPGTKTEIDDDDWPQILERLLAADIIVFATPVWWGIQSSVGSLYQFYSRFGGIRCPVYYHCKSYQSLWPR